MTSRQRQKNRPARKRRSSPQLPPLPKLVTVEGDPVVFAARLYRHDALATIRQRLTEADDFDWDADGESKEGGSFEGSWWEPAKTTQTAQGMLTRRTLATLSLTSTTLRVETMSRRRMIACGRRLQELLGNLICLVDAKFKTVEQVLREPTSQPEPEPVVLPPEVIAQLEEQTLRDWIEDSIPALGGMTPRDAVKTPEGRRRVLNLIEYITRQQQRLRSAPGIISPDYRKAKKLLGLE